MQFSTTTSTAIFLLHLIFISLNKSNGISNLLKNEIQVNTTVKLTSKASKLLQIGNVNIVENEIMADENNDLKPEKEQESNEVDKSTESYREIDMKQKVQAPVKLNMKQGLTMNQILNVYAMTDVQNQLCKNHSSKFARALRAFEPWALKMFDASSKLQSGVLSGNLMEFGAFQQCLQIYESTDYGPIRGKLCTLKIYPNVKLMKKILSYRNITDRRFSKVYTFVKNAALVWTVCIPDSCEVDDVLQHYDKLIYGFTEGLNLTVSLERSDCVTMFDVDKPLNNVEIGIIVAFGLYLLLIIVVTIMELYSTPEEVGTSKLINVFSAYSNSRQIFARSKGQSDLDCVHGIRFLSTCYVVIGHRYLMLMFFPVVNSLQIMNWVLYYRSTAITGGTLCVDTFFMISGMLASIGYFDHVAKAPMNWPMFYIYRYMRITPPLAIVVLWYATLIQHLGSGPVWNDMLSIVQKPCQEYWWATITHIQNYVHPFPLCLTQGWYLTCDMQYYFLSPIVLVPLEKWPRFGYINYMLIYVASVGMCFYLAWINKYEGGVPVTNQLFSTKYFQHHYIAPHARASTYIIGLGFGYTIHKTRGTKRKIGYSTAIAGWLISIATMAASLVGCHTFHTEEHEYNRIEDTIYLSFSRSAWTFGLVWMVWACINGYGGPINSILSSHTFRVLGRISYGVYLLHMLMQYLTSGASKMPGYFSDFSALYAAFSDLFIMVIIGFVFTVCFESPLVKALNLLLRGGKRVKPITVQPKQ